VEVARLAVRSASATAARRFSWILSTRLFKTIDECRFATLRSIAARYAGVARFSDRLRSSVSPLLIRSLRALRSLGVDIQRATVLSL
jgi:hypothetical protein